VPHIISDRVKERVQSPAGTGTLSLLNTVSGYRRFSSVMSSGDTCYYCLESPSNGDWECGLGTYSSNNALSRTTVYSSSNSGAIVNFANRVSYAFISYVASRAIYLDPSGELNLALSALNDVSLTAPASGESLKYNGSSWVNGVASGYTTEEAQDAVGSILLDTSSVSFSYNDGTPSISASVKNSGITDVMISGGVDALKIGSGSVSSAEFGYLDGVTSSLQVQLDSKYASANPSGFISAASVASAYQPLDADLTSIASTGVDPYGIGLLTKTSGSGVRDYIGAGTSSFDGAYGSLSGTPSTFAPSTHTHSNIQVIAGTGLSGGGDLSTDRTINLANTTVVPGSYTLSSFTVDAQGRITTAASGSVDLSSYLTSSVASATYQPLDADLTSLASASGSGIYERSAGTWTPVVIGTGLSLGSGILSNTLDLSGYLTSSVASATYVPLTRTLNGLALSANQTFAVGTSGTDFAIASSGTAHTFSIPDAGASARGLVTTGTQTIAGVKTFALGTVTTSQPLSITQTWNNGAVNFTAVDINITDTSSSTSSNLLLLRKGATNYVVVRASAAAVNDVTQSILQVNLPTSYGGHAIIGWRNSFQIGGGVCGDIYNSNSPPTLPGVVAGVIASSRTSTVPSFVVTDGTNFAKLWVASSNTLEMRDSTNAQTFRVYNTYTSSTSFETGQLSWVSNEFRIGSAVGSAGGTQRSTVIGSTNSAGTWSPFFTVNTNGQTTTTFNTSAVTVGHSVVGTDGTTYWQIGSTLQSGNSYVQLTAAGTAGTAQGRLNLGAGYLYVEGGPTTTGIKTYGTLTLAPAALGGSGGLIVTQTVATSGSPTGITYTDAAHTTMTASTEATSVNFNLSSTKQFATGAITTQRAMRIQAPTYSFVGASTITQATTLSVSGGPIAGTNATISNSYSIYSEADLVGSVGDVVVTSATGAFGVRSGPSGSNRIQMKGGSGLEMASSYYVAWGANSTNVNSLDTYLYRDAAGVLAQRNSTNAQTFRVYNTYTSSTSFETGQLSWASNEFRIGSAVGSAGGTQRSPVIGVWNAAGTFLPGLTVSTNINANSWINISGVAVQVQSSGDLQLRTDAASNLLYLGANSGGCLFHGVLRTLQPNTGGFTIVQPALTTTAFAPIITTSLGAHTNLTLSTEATDVNFNLARTVQFATGAITTQRAMRIQAPTYGFVGASTITTASTLSISGPPVAGTNATITNAYALNVESGNSYFAGNVRAVGSSVYTPSYGFGSDNSGFFRSTSSRIFLGLNGNVQYDFNSGNLSINSGSYGVAGGSVDSTSADVLWVRDAAGVWATRNGTNAQTLRVYNTYTSATSYERLNIKGVASANFEIGPENGSAGGTLRGLTIGGYPAGTATTVGWAQFRPNTSTGALEAFYLGPIADSTATGGNARGTNSVDLQIVRTGATQVAAGARSFLAGARSIASGADSYVIGNDCTGSGQYSIALGTFIQATNYAAVSFGVNGLASGNQSLSISMGNGGTASASKAFICGEGVSSATNSWATGFGVLADRQGMASYAQGYFAANGDAQKTEWVLRNKTTDATPVNLFANGSSARLTIPSGKTMTGFLIVKGIKSDGSAKARFVRLVDITNVGGTTALDTPIEAIGTDYNPSACVLVVTAENATDDLQINITGPAGETWRWVGTFNGLEIAYGT